MRTKIALLFGVMALLAASVAPAAQGKSVSINENGVPLADGATFQGHSYNLVFTTIWGNFTCKWGNLPEQGEALTTKVVKNKADPAVLNGFSGPAACLLNGKTPLPTTSEATGPVELFGNGTGKLPIKFVVYYSPEQPCTYTGVLNLTPTPGSNNAHVQGPIWAPGCGPAEVRADLSFTRSNGVPVSFVYS